MYVSLKANRVPEVLSFSVLWCEVSLDSGLAKSSLASAPISRGGGKKNKKSIECPNLCYVIQTALSTSGNNYRTGKTTQQDRKVQGKV